jgi:hypothetical protein
MKHLRMLIVLFLFTGDLFSQIQGYILNKETNAPVIFANIWVAGEDVGTTSDSLGYFRFEKDFRNKSLIISSIGYERAEVLIDSTFLHIFLVPVMYEIREVTVRPRSGKEYIIADYTRWQLLSYTFPANPQIFARYFPYIPKYSINQVIKRIEIATFSKVVSTVNLRFFAVNAEGEPGQDMLKSNYPVSVKKGKRTTRIDNLDTLGIRMPENGLFIAFEFLIIKENEWIAKGVDSDTGKRVTATIYNPGLGNIRADASVASWNYRGGKWYRDLGKYNKQDKKSYSLAMKVVVVD